MKGKNVTMGVKDSRNIVIHPTLSYASEALNIERSTAGIIKGSGN